MANEQAFAGHLLSTVTHLVARAGVRYWEDATVNDVEDADGDLIPGRVGDDWWVQLRLADGVIEGWPAGTSADVHYKVCDDGQYWLLDASGTAVGYYDGYVPAHLCHGDNGYGDYIILKIDGEGRIADYRHQPIDTTEPWEPVTARTPTPPHTARDCGRGARS